MAIAGALIVGTAVVIGCAPLTAFNTVIPKDAGSRQVAEGVAYGEGPRRMLDVYAPLEGADLPMIVFFYGGGWSDGRRQDYAFAGRALAAQGFVVVIPDYRLVPEVRFPSFLEDAAAAVAYARANAARFNADPDRILLAGHSAGAYIGAMLAVDRQYLAAVDVPRSAIRAFAGLSGPYDFIPFDVSASIDAFGEAPDPLATQPITFAGTGDPPSLLVTGDADETVGVYNSENLAALLRGAGVPVELKIYPGLSHADTLLALSRPLRDETPVLADVAAFFRQYSGGGS